MTLSIKAVALSIAFLAIITTAALSTTLALPLALSADIAQFPLTIEQATYGMAASLIALSAIIFMMIREKANNLQAETLQNFLSKQK